MSTDLERTQPGALALIDGDLGFDGTTEVIAGRCRACGRFTGQDRTHFCQIREPDPFDREQEQMREKR